MQRTQSLGHHRSGRSGRRSGGLRCDWPECSAGRGPATQCRCGPGAGAAGGNRLAGDGSASWCHLRRHGRSARGPAAGLAALGQPHRMGARQARHLLAPARSHIRLAPSYLPGHSSPARYPDPPRPAVLPDDGVYLPQSPGYREVPAVQVLCPAGWIGPKLDPDQARNDPKTQWTEHGGWARPGNPGTEYLKQYRNARSSAADSPPGRTRRVASPPCAAPGQTPSSDQLRPPAHWWHRPVGISTSSATGYSALR